MARSMTAESVIHALDLAGVPEGPVLRPLEPVPDAERALAAAWETPLAPWGGFGLDSGLTVLADGVRTVLGFAEGRHGKGMERAIVARGVDLRDGRIVARALPIESDARPNDDCANPPGALAGIVFRAPTSRAGYWFGIETKKRAVLYRRTDDEWLVLAEQTIDLPDDYVTLDVRLDGDAIRCACPECGVAFAVTDTGYASGRVGFRARGGARLAEFRITQTPGAKAREAHRHMLAAAEEEARGRAIPDAVLIRTYDVAALCGAPRFADFAVAGRFDILVEGQSSLRALAADGTVLWETAEPFRRAVFSRDHTENGRLIYAFAGRRESREHPDVSGQRKELVIDDEMVVLRGADGAVLARETLPPGVPTMRFFDWSPTSGALGSDAGTDIVLREWRDDHGGGGVRLWAYDRDLNLLWHDVQSGAHYGHHYALAMFDVDGNGRDELLAGGVLYRGDGCVAWKHDRAEEMVRWPGAGHYDAVALGNLAGDDETDPTAFLFGGSAGVYVVDGLSGETRAVHRIGHAQGRAIGVVRPELPGVQLLAATRWGTMGILTLFTGRGERLWTIQPDFVGQGACPVTWGSAGHRLVWTNTTRDAQAFHDGHGRRVKRLAALSDTWGDRMGKDVGRGGSPIRIGTGATDYLTLTCAGTVHVFGPKE